VTRPTSEQWHRIEALFDELVEQPPAEQCRRLEMLGDADIAAELASLLAASRASSDFLTLPAAAAVSLDDTTIPADTRIGAWRILGLLGRGGMGAVYRVERADGQFRQQAALKLARVEALPHPEHFHNERQILATLEHPGIAHLIDGGLTPDGHPYMVMELVEGQDLLSYCHEHRLGLQQRLTLFGQVCEAVGYAHRHLVVHRDLKPNNIFVTTDGRVKLLDFGVAKLLDASYRAESGVTIALMTPDYAAPEQLEGRPATTATDVFALGLLLYALLTGAPPWNLRELPLPAALQRLLNSDPRRPSIIAAETAAAPVPASALRGDLDAIVLKALRREPEERYATAGEFWADVQRHLEHRPVLARGGARFYLARRFVRRYRVLVLATAAVFATLVAGLGGTLWQAHRAVQERDLFEAQDERSKAVSDYLALMLRSGGKGNEGQSITLRDMLEQGARHLDQQFAGRPADYAAIVVFFGDLYAELGDEQSAVSLEKTFIESPAAAAVPETAAEIRVTLAQSVMRQGDAKAAGVILAPAQAFWAALPEKYRGRLARSRIIEGQIVKAGGDLAGAIAIYRRGLTEIVGADGVVPEDTSDLENSLGLALLQAGDYPEADRLMQKAREFWEAEGRVTETLLVIIQNQGTIAMYRGDYARAEALLRQTIDERRRSFGPSGAMAAGEVILAKVLIRESRFQPALDQLQEARPMATQFIGPESPAMLGVYFESAEAELGLGQADQAAPLIEDGLRVAAKTFGEHHARYASGLILEARLRLSQTRVADARQLADQAGDILAKAGLSGREQRVELEALKADIAAQGG